MLSSSPLRPSVPSASLLRFLRGQSVSISSTCLRRPRPSLRRNTSSWACVEPVPCQVLSPKKTSLRRRPSVSLNTQTKLHIQPVSSRNSSSSSRPLLRRLFDLKRSRAAESKVNSPSRSSLVDEKTEPNFTIARSLAAKASNEIRLRCTEFDSSGNVTVVNGEFKKSELIAKVSI